MTATRVLLALAALFVVAVLAAWTVFVVTDRDRALNDAERELAVMSKLLEEHARRTLEAVDLLLQRLDAQIRLRGTDWLTADFEPFPELSGIATAVPQVASLWVVGADGQVLANSLTGRGGGGSLAGQEYFRVLRDGAETTVGALMDPDKQEPAFFAMGRRIGGRDGGFQGAVVAALYLDFFRNFYRTLDLPAGSTLLLMRSDAMMLLREPPAPNTVGHRVATPVAPVTDREPVRSAVVVSSIDGLERLVLHRKVEGYPVVVVASRPVSTILVNWWERVAYTGILVAVLLLAVAALVPIGLRAVRAEARLREAVSAANVGLERNVALRTAELERALADKNLLLSEVYHRVKNNLQLVEALLAMQSTRLSDEQGREAFAATRRRINTLGLVHQQLLQAGDLATLDMQRFLSDLCGNIAFGFGAEERGVQISVMADPIYLDLDKAIPLGLLVNELVSNAFKHAFPEGGGGGIAVTATRRSDQGLILGVADTGVGWVPTVEGGPQGPVRSSGDRIIRALVAQLGGEMAVLRDGGTEVRVDLPDVEDSHGR